MAFTSRGYAAQGGAQYVRHLGRVRDLPVNPGTFAGDFQVEPVQGLGELVAEAGCVFAVDPQTGRPFDLLHVTADHQGQFLGGERAEDLLAAEGEDAGGDPPLLRGTAGCHRGQILRSSWWDSR